nr:MAG TPA: hypothetical protein [Microviridae sp.]
MSERRGSCYPISDSNFLLLSFFYIEILDIFLINPLYFLL